MGGFFNLRLHVAEIMISSTTYGGVTKCGTFGIIFRMDGFLLLFWRTLGIERGLLRLVCECGSFGRGKHLRPARSAISRQVNPAHESHSIVFAPKISDQLGVSAKRGIICIADAASKCLAELDY